MVSRPAPVVLAVAGTDPGGGAGLSADALAVAAAGGWCAPVVAAVTAQSTHGVTGVEVISADHVAAQIDAVTTDVEVAAVKVGMLGSVANVEAVAGRVDAGRLPHVVVDPVMTASAGGVLSDGDVAGHIAALVAHLLPVTAVVTPNLAEAAALAGRGEVPTERGEIEALAEVIGSTGVGAVVITGGHLAGSPSDLVWTPAGVTWVDGERVEASHDHGTGCVFSSTLATRLAFGDDLEAAAVAAASATRHAITHGMDWGRGPGPVDPAWRLRSP